jgi:hypothetical protein|nr:MAG TPA_asm: 4Fe-4S single cluster domain protein [Caudoviricetes sp.]
MNIQISAPYQPCVYHCPFCVARGHKHEYKFDDLYGTDEQRYFKKLRDFLIEYSKKIDGYPTVIITGECDPSQNMRWATKVANECSDLGCKVEFQTHNLSLKERDLPRSIKVLSYSITNPREYLSAWRYTKPTWCTNRMVMILRDGFGFLNKDNFSPMGFDQVTFKALNEGEDDRINAWIANHRPGNIDNFYEIMESRNGSTLSVRVDTTCQQAEGRYYVFRSDGKVYESWEAAEPIGGM